MRTYDGKEEKYINCILFLSWYSEKDRVFYLFVKLTHLCPLKKSRNLKFSIFINYNKIQN